MVTLEQVEQLDERVRKVIGVVESLRHENARLLAENRRLFEENQKLEYHLQESERRSLALSGAQEMLEKGLMGAIDRLDSLSEAGTENAAPAVKVQPDDKVDPNSDAGLEALLADDPAAEETHHGNNENSSGSQEDPLVQERKMDIF